jgi:hypothetical protein
MNRFDLICLVAANVPPGLKRLRGRLMLEHASDWLGVREVCCPGCSGCGWADLAELATCPLCLGFRLVPAQLARWFQAKTKRLQQLGGSRRGGPAEEPVAVLQAVDFQVCADVERFRCGRLADAPLRCHAPVSA